MTNITCHVCGSAINTITSSVSAPPWCPVCGRDFQPAKHQSTVIAELRPVRAATPDLVALTVPSARPHADARAEPRQPSPARPTAPLPPGVPPEISACGNPEQVFASSDRFDRRSRILLRVLFGIIALAFGAIGGFHVWVLDHPLPGYDITRSTALNVGIAFSALVVVLMVSAFVLTSDAVGGRLWGSRTYLLYEDVLIELRAGRRRVIPWETVGDSNCNGLVDLYRFPVAGGRALTFDGAVENHPALAQAIKRYSAERRFRLAFGDDAGLDAMRAALVGLSVVAHVIGRPSLGYRITLLGERLLFLRIGWHGPDRAPAPILTAGLIGGAINAFNSLAHAAAREKADAERQRVELADAPTLIQMAQQSAGSFVAGPDDLEAIRLDPPTEVGLGNLFERLDGPEEVCLLRLQHARHGLISLALQAREDVLTIVQTWGAIFGDVMDVNVAWSHSTCAFVARR